MDYKKFNQAFDLNALKNDVKEVEENGGGNFDKVPCGTYEVKVKKLELKESKKGDPMVTAWFKILTGDHKGQLIFMNQVITQGFQLHIMNTLLREMDTGIEIKFDDFQQYADLLFDVAEKIDEDKLEFALELGENKGFNTYKIVEVFEGN